MKLSLISAGMTAALVLAPIAEAADTSIAVLGIEATDGAPESVASAITEVLRQRAAAEKGLKVVPGKDLIEIKLIFSCPDEAPSCMADAGGTLGASKMIFGSVKRAPGDTLVVTLKMLDVARKQVVAWAGGPLRRNQTTEDSLRGQLQEWFATLMGRSAMGMVKITGDVPGVSIALDGVPSGVLSSEALVLRNVPAGRREILASKPGYPPQRKEITVSSGSTTDVNIEMAGGLDGDEGPLPIATPAYGGEGLDDDPTRLTAGVTADENRTGLRAATWVTALGSLASFGLTIKLALDVSSINEDLDPYRRFECKATGVRACEETGNQELRILTAGEQEYAVALQEDGNRLEKYQYIALGTGAVLAVASGVLFYFSYLDGGQPSLALGATKDAPRLSLAPLVQPGGGGLVGLLTY